MKTTKAPAPKTTTTHATKTPDALALVSAIYCNDGHSHVAGLLREADAALSWLVDEHGAIFPWINGAAERLNLSALPPVERYAAHVATVEAGHASGDPAVRAVADAADMVRLLDVDAAFAIGMAAGLRLAGGR